MMRPPDFFHRSSWQVLGLTLLLWLAWQMDLANAIGFSRHNPPRVAMFATNESTFDQISTELVLRTAQARLDGTADTGFMKLERYGTYYSQFGVAGDVLSGVARITHDVASAAAATMMMWRLLAALLASWLVVWCCGTISPTAGAVLGCYFLFGDYVTLAAGHVYWTYATALAIFVAPWWLLAKHGAGSPGLWHVFAWHVGLCTIRFLGGYEFLPMLILSPATAICFYLWREDRRTFTGLMKALVMIGVAGSLGFGLAIAAQVTKGVISESITPQEVIAKVRDRAAFRSSIQSNQDPQQSHEKLEQILPGYKKLEGVGIASPKTAVYFMWAHQAWRLSLSRVLSFPGGFGVPLFVVVILASLAGLGWWRQRLKVTPSLRATGDSLGIATVGAGAITLAWCWVAADHFLMHATQTAMAFQFCLMPTLFLFLGAVLSAGRSLKATS